MRFALAAGCLVLAAASAGAAPPEPPREFRGVWVASVGNIDWPSKSGLPADDQKRELVALLDRFKALNFNAVVLQVRPMCDSLYESKLEPWSEFLTGASGRSPGYDPLAFAVTEAHRRGLELHAWFNPYRAKSPTAKSDLDPTHLVKRRPDLAKTYGKHSWLNPTSREVQDHSLAVIADVVKRYDIDGVHLDDYFYPYPELDAAKVDIPFPDDDTWAAYTTAGGKLPRDDWRRDAVNTFVKKLYAETHAAKPWVKVGISPFGIWKPGHPEGIAGFDQHGKLYADAKLWLNEGWVDYWTPQLYWPIAQEKQSYPKLLNWWAGENAKKRHLWPGNIPSRVGAAKPWPASEIVEQIELTRTVAGGNVHFSAKPILANVAGIADEFAKVYATPALVPASPWLGDTEPAVPVCDGVYTTDPAGYWLKLPVDCVAVVQVRVGETWTTTRLGVGVLLWPATRDAGEAWVRSVSRSGILSDAVRLPCPPPRPAMPTVKPRKGRAPLATLGELLDRLGGVSPHRVCADPPPGTATVRDFIRRIGRTPSGELFELIDRTFVLKPMGAPESVITMQMACHIYRYLDGNPIAFVVGAAYPIKVAPGLVRVPSFSVTMWPTRPTGFFTTDPIAKEIPALVAVLLDPQHTDSEIARAVKDYFAAGVQQFWLVDIRKLEVWDYSAPDVRTVVRGEASLTAPSILPGYHLPLADAFRYLPEPSAWESST